MNPQEEICWIVAGNHEEFNQYVMKKLAQASILRQEPDFTYRYIANAESMRGITIHQGFYIGSWRNRPDLKEIQQQIALCKRQPWLDDASHAAFIEAAAKRMAADIDAQVLDNLTKKFAPPQP